MAWAFVPIMENNISSYVGIEARLFIHAALTGVFLILVYDILRIFRRVCEHGAIWIGIEDFFYWIFASLVIFGVLLKENNGVFRWFFVIGMLIGMIIYYIFVGRYFVVLLAMVINKALDIAKKIIKLIVKPINKMVIFLAKPIKNIIKCRIKQTKYIKKVIEKKKQESYNNKK